MTIGAADLDTCWILEMAGQLILFINGVSHFMAGDTELIGVGVFDKSIERPPKEYTENKSDAQKHHTLSPGTRPAC